ncbi:MAG: nickel pincer cofactor biosynthesis protein LarC [Candidatus Obscuribacterales bacterium]|nr:nickel pincer cofactor biosynthesis protein LarC [Candidatus Obscuribacterales bacterium]
MKVAYFDCQFGAAGDMLIAALIDAGLPLDHWKAQVARIALPVGSFDVRISSVTRCTIAATKFDVDITPVGLSFDSGAAPESHHRHSGDSHDHGEHDHHHGHDHSHGSPAHSPWSDDQSENSPSPLPQPDYNPSFDHTHLAVHGRTLVDVTRIIDQSEISSGAKHLALRIFERMATAEAKVHGVRVEQVHFHEVGAIDAIVDIVGFAIAYDMMGIGRSDVSRVPAGRGYVKTAHGLLPVPAPAVVNLMKDAAMATSTLELDYECLTPTGAAILAEIGSSFGGPMGMERIVSSGYGAGTKDPRTLPNVCRVFIGEVAADGKRFATDMVCVVEANVDDMTPQAIGTFIETCFLSGALDVSVVPCTMKKSRPGHLITVLCKPDLQKQIEEAVLVNTTSLGVRAYQCERRIAARESVSVPMKGGHEICVKLARDSNENIVNVQPEWDDCCRYARALGIPVKKAYMEAITAYYTATTAEASSTDFIQRMDFNT